MNPHPHELSQALAVRILDVVQTLASDRQILQSRESIRLGTKGSLAIDTRAVSAGVWYDHEAGCGGDALDLVKHLRGGTIKDALAWSTSWLGGSAPIEYRPSEPSRPREVKSDLWRSIWAEGKGPSGSPVEQYLGSRGLLLDSKIPLRFHPACPRGDAHLPAMLSLMTDPVTAAPVGVHRTYLKHDGAGKADVEPAKMMLGNAGVVRLSPDENVSTSLGICEGIENGIALLTIADWSPVWAAGSAGGIAKFPVLAGIEAITIFADADDKGAGLTAARTCATRWREAGREVVIRRPPAGMDWLDAFQAVA